MSKSPIEWPGIALQNGTEELSFESRLVSPEDALRLLTKKSFNNRKVSARRRVRLKKAMTGGQWKLNGEVIHLDADGRLINGFHRMEALAELAEESPGIQIPMTFCLLPTKASSIASSIFDDGRARTYCDRLTWLGWPNAAKVSAVLSLLWPVRNGQMPVYAGVTIEATPETQINFAKLCDRAVNIQAIVTIVAKIATVMRYGSQVGAVTALACGIEGVKPVQAADGSWAMPQKSVVADFLDGLSGGGTATRDGRRGHPSRLVRDMCLRAIGKGSKRFPSVEVTSRLILAWNCLWRSEREVAIKAIAGYRKQFPLIDGLDHGDETPRWKLPWADPTLRSEEDLWVEGRRR